MKKWNEKTERMKTIKRIENKKYDKIKRMKNE